MNSLIKVGILTTALLAGFHGSLHAQKAGPVKMRDVATHDSLSLKLRMAQQKDPIRELGPAIGKTEEDPSKRVTSRDLIASSAVLSYRGMLTLVPKRAVLYFPEKFEDRKGVIPDPKVKTFQDFYLQNRNWIRTVEVTREQALGHVPLAEGIVESFEDSDYVVIATYKTGPISVLPLKDPEEVPLPSEMKSVIYAK